jgi:hypothetical protein
MAATRESQKDIKARQKLLGRPTAPRHWGWKHVTREGNKILVPNIEERKLMQLVVRLHEEGVGWHKLEVELEKIIAPLQGRKPIHPIFAGWSVQKLKLMYRRELEIQAMEDGQRERHAKRLQQIWPDEYWFGDCLD